MCGLEEPQPVSTAAILSHWEARRVLSVLPPRPRRDISAGECPLWSSPTGTDLACVQSVGANTVMLEKKDNKIQRFNNVTLTMSNIG